MTMPSYVQEALRNHPEWADMLDPASLQTGQATATPQAAQIQAPVQSNPLPASSYPVSSALGTTPLVAPGRDVPTNPYPAIPPIQNGGSPLQAAWEAQQNLIGNQLEYIGIEDAMLGVKPEERAATRLVQQAREADIGANRAYLNEQTRANAQRIADAKALEAAKNNVGDKINVGRAQRERQVYSYRYSLAGLPTPVEIDLPDDWEGPLPPGVVERIKTLEQIVASNIDDKEAMRKFRVEAARIHAANTGLSVTEAQIAQGRVALKIDEMEDALEKSGLAVKRANLALAATGLPPSPGLVWDEITNNWTSPTQASFNQSQEMKRLQDEAKVAGPDLGLGEVPAGTLMSWATAKPPVITDEELRTALIASGLSPAIADRYVQNARTIRANQKTEEGSADILAILQRLAEAGGETTTTQTATQYTPPNIYGGGYSPQEELNEP